MVTHSKSDKPTGTFPVPKIVKDLIIMHGEKNRAAKAASIDPSHFGPISLGQREITPGVKAKIEAALKGQPLSPNEPPITSSFMPTAGKKNGKVSAKYNDPPMLAELIAKNSGIRGRAAQAMGYSTPATMNQWATGEKPFDDLAQERVRRALKGEPPPSEVGYDEPDTYRLNLVIGMFHAASFERAYEAAEAFNGKCIFKAQVRTEWLAVWKMQQDKAKLFKRVMGRDAIKITCP